MTLLSILFTLLFTFIGRSAQFERKIELAHAKILERQNLQLRLQDILTSLSRENGMRPLYTKKIGSEKDESLVVLFDNGIDPDPAFSGTVLGRLFKDSESNLCLAIWPILKQKRNLWRKEVLLSRIDSYELSLLGEILEKDPAIARVNAAIGWMPHWKKERSDLPGAIRLTVVQNKAKLRFAFRLPSSRTTPTYQGG